MADPGITAITRMQTFQRILGLLELDARIPSTKEPQFVQQAFEAEILEELARRLVLLEADK
jgi:hypothetical protein